MTKTLLAIDLSTTCTGYAFFDVTPKENPEHVVSNLLSYGKIKGKSKGLSKDKYPKKPLMKMIHMGEEILQLINNLKPDHIVFEEISGSTNRLSQKTLDGCHFVVAWIIEEYLDRVSYQDVTGSDGWRSALLGLRLSDADKKNNKESNKLNKKLMKTQKLPIIGPKHLSCRFANWKFGTNFDVDNEPTDADAADAICLGYAFSLYKMFNLHYN